MQQPNHSPVNPDKMNEGKSVAEVIQLIKEKMPPHIANAKITTRPLTPEESTTEARLKRALSGIIKPE